MNNNENAAVESTAQTRTLPKKVNFDPMQFAREVATEAGKTLTLDLKHKKDWFRLACPKGGVVLNPLRVTDQMAIFEARLFADTDDRNPLGASRHLPFKGPYWNVPVERSETGGFLRAAEKIKTSRMYFPWRLMALNCFHQRVVRRKKFQD